MLAKKIFQILGIFFLKAAYAGEFIRYRRYKKNPKDDFQGVEDSKPLHLKSKIAIVIQGPILERNDFTKNTLSFYRKIFPNVEIIFSTWPSPFLFEIDFKGLNINLIVNDEPAYAGIANINKQIISSASGIRRAKDIGVKYVLKTRSDQRIYNHNLFKILLNLIDFFPLDSKFRYQNKRIVACSLNTFKYRLYGISDMFLFGDIDDMSLYWSCPLDYRSISSFEKREKNTWRQYSTQEICEIYLCRSFVINVRGLEEASFTLNDSMRVYAENFIIIDESAVKLFWNKYTMDENRYSYINTSDPLLTFNDWLGALIQVRDGISFDESIIDYSII